jgi:hypothetical protein
MTKAEIETLNKVHGILAKEHATTTWNQVPNKFQLEIAKNLVEGIITNESPYVRDHK